MRYTPGELVQLPEHQTLLVHAQSAQFVSIRPEDWILVLAHTHSDRPRIKIFSLYLLHKGQVCVTFSFEAADD